MCERWWRNGEGAGLECGRCPVQDERWAICFQTLRGRGKLFCDDEIGRKKRISDEFT